MIADKKNALIAIICLIFLSGCAAGRYDTRQTPYRREAGIYHRVERGQTLWSISRQYNIPLETLVQANYLPDAAKINVGQMIFMPGQTKEYARAGSPETRFSANKDFIWPVKGDVMSYFGSKKWDVKNKGIDIETAAGTPVCASRSGKVTFSDEKVRGYGKTIILDHGDGYMTVYSHILEIFVKVGDNVKQGERIATVGTSGRTSSARLHFEIRKGSRPQNPFYYLP